MNDNRYAAPTTVVADFDQVAGVERPRHVVIGVGLLWMQLVLGIPGMINQVMNPTSAARLEGPARTVFLVVMAAVMGGSVLLYALFNWKSWQGRNWARIVHLVFLCLSLVMVYWALSTIFAKSRVEGAVYVMQTLLNIAGVSLLFTRPANSWYRALRDARR